MLTDLHTRISDHLSANHRDFGSSHAEVLAKLENGMTYSEAEKHFPEGFTRKDFENLESKGLITTESGGFLGSNKYKFDISALDKFPGGDN